MTEHAGMQQNTKLNRLCLAKKCWAKNAKLSPRARAAAVKKPKRIFHWCSGKNFNCRAYKLCQEI